MGYHVYNNIRTYWNFYSTNPEFLQESDTHKCWEYVLHYELYHPEYKNVPLAVGGSEQARHGIILAKNQLAKKYNIDSIAVEYGYGNKEEFIEEYIAYAQNRIEEFEELDYKNPKDINEKLFKGGYFLWRNF